MKSFKRSGALAAILVAALLCLLAPRAGAQTGSISGTILDVNGKPWAEVVIRAVSDQAQSRRPRRIAEVNLACLTCALAFTAYLLSSRAK